MQEENLLPWRWAILVGHDHPAGRAAVRLHHPRRRSLDGHARVPVRAHGVLDDHVHPYFSGVLLCIAGGVLADRIGLGKVFLVAFAIAALGALARCFVVDYWGLFIASFFMGTGVAALNANSAKLRVCGSLVPRIRSPWASTLLACRQAPPSPYTSGRIFLRSIRHGGSASR